MLQTTALTDAHVQSWRGKARPAVHIRTVQWAYTSAPIAISFGKCNHPCTYYDTSTYLEHLRDREATGRIKGPPPFSPFKCNKTFKFDVVKLEEVIKDAFKQTVDPNATEHLVTFMFQNGYPSQKRSLVEDAKFETRVHQETKKTWLEAVRQQSEGNKHRRNRK